MPRLLFIDSGLGGLTVVRACQAIMPEAEAIYIADDAWFPYGALDETALAARVSGLVAAALKEHAPDCVLIACNTASTVVLPVLRASFAVPFVGTVPAIKPAALLTKSGIVGVLATPGTVERDYTRSLIAAHGQGVAFALAGAPRLAAMAEAYGQGAVLEQAELAQEIAPCFLDQGGRRTDVVVLACTHYPLLLDQLAAAAPWPVYWLDPAPAIARRAANVLAEQGHVIGVGANKAGGAIQFTSGKMSSAPLAAFLKPFKLAMSGQLCAAAAP